MAGHGWFHWDAEEAIFRGPFAPAAIRDKVNTKALTVTSLVWHTTQAPFWTPICALAAFGLATPSQSSEPFHGKAPSGPPSEDSSHAQRSSISAAVSRRALPAATIRMGVPRPAPAIDTSHSEEEKDRASTNNRGSFRGIASASARVTLPTRSSPAPSSPALRPLMRPPAVPQSPVVPPVSSPSEPRRSASASVRITPTPRLPVSPRMMVPPPLPGR